jgi:hypothetical protein
MPDDKPLSDDEAHARIHAAALALGSAPGATTRGDTALKAARRALGILMYGLVKAIDENSDRVEGVKRE